MTTVFSRYKRLLAAASLAALLPLAVACDGSPGPTEEFVQTYSVFPGASLKIENDNGGTTVSTDFSASATREVRVEATLEGADHIDFSVTETEDGIVITADSDSVGFFRRSPQADIRVIVPPGMPVDVSSGNGKIEITGTNAAVKARTGNGGIELQSVEGDISASSGNGSITINNARGSFNVTTGNGSLSLTAELTPGGENRLTTGNGRITVHLEGEPDVSIDAETDNGSLDSSLQLTEIETVGGKRLVGRIGDGSATLTIRTGNGSIELR